MRILEVGEPEVLPSAKSSYVEKDEIAATIRVRGNTRKDSSREVNVSAITYRLEGVEFLQLIPITTDDGKLLALRPSKSPENAFKVTYHDHKDKFKSQATVSSKALVERLFKFHGIKIPTEPDSHFTLRLQVQQVSPGLFAMWKKY